jgi:hypothetical protein
MLTGLLFGLTAAAPAQNLRLSLEVDRAEFALGEPVVVYAALRNEGGAPVQASPHLEPDYGYVTYFVAAEGGAEAAFTPWALKEPAVELETLAPGAEVKRAAKIFFGGSGWTFRQPGRFNVKAVYEGGITSNTLALTVTAPADRAGREAADLLLGSDEAGKFLLFEGGDHLREGRRRVEHVAEKLSASPHAAYAAAALAESLLRDFADFTRGELRKADPQRARELAELARGRRPAFYYLARGYLALAEAYRKTGEPARGRAAIEEINKLAAESFPTLVPILRQMSGRPSTGEGPPLSDERHVDRINR